MASEKSERLSRHTEPRAEERDALARTISAIPATQMPRALFRFPSIHGAPPETKAYRSPIIGRYICLSEGRAAPETTSDGMKKVANHNRPNTTARLSPLKNSPAISNARIRAGTITGRARSETASEG